MSEYIKTVVDAIKNKRVKEQVEAELYDHVMNKAALYEARGFSSGTAAEKANADMGKNASEVGEQLSAVDRSILWTDVVVYLFFLFLLTAEGFAHFVQFTVEQDALFWNFEIAAQPPYVIALPWLQLLLLAFQSASLLVAVRRRYILMPVLSAAALAVSARFNTAVSAFFLAFFSGNIGEYTANISYFEVFFENKTLFWINACLYALAVGLALAICALNVRYRRGRLSGRDLKRRRMLTICVAAFLFVHCCAFFAQNVAQAVYGKDHHIVTSAANVGFIMSDEIPELAEEEKHFIFFTDVYSVDFEEEPLFLSDELDKISISREVKPFGLFFAVPEKRIVLHPDYHRYYQIAYYENDFTTGPQLIETELITLSQGETFIREWENQGVHYILEVTNG